MNLLIYVQLKTIIARRTCACLLEKTVDTYILCACFYGCLGIWFHLHACLLSKAVNTVSIQTTSGSFFTVYGLYLLLYVFHLCIRIFTCIYIQNIYVHIYIHKLIYDYIAMILDIISPYMFLIVLIIINITKIIIIIITFLKSLLSLSQLISLVTLSFRIIIIENGTVITAVAITIIIIIIIIVVTVIGMSFVIMITLSYY